MLRATTIAGPEGLLPQVRGMRVASDYGRVPIAFVHIQVMCWYVRVLMLKALTKWALSVPCANLSLGARVVTAS